MSKKYFGLNMDLLYDPSYLSVKRLNTTGKQHWYEHVFLPTIQYLDNIIEVIDDYDRDSRDYWYILIELRKKVVNIAIYMEVIVYKDNGKLEKNTKLQEINHDKKLAKKLADYTKQLDKHRGQDVNDIIPGFYEYIK